MAEMVKVSVKTPCCGKLYWVKGLIEEDGALNELSGNYERSATIRFDKDSEQAKQIQAVVDKMWADFKEANPKVKQAQPKSTPIKPVLDKDGNETNEIEVKFKTNAKFPDGKPNWVKIYNAKGQNVTQQFIDDQILIGNDSLGIIYGTFTTYEYAKQFGITSYLKAVQIVKLVKYEEDIDVDDLSDVAGEEAFGATEGNTEPVTGNENIPF